MTANMDIDTLGRMVAEGFASMQDQLATMQTYMDERFDAIDIHFDSLEKEVRLTNQHIDRVVMPTLDSHATRIKNLELKFN